MLIGLIADSHGHEMAFLKGLRVLSAEGARITFFLGDAIGYFPSVAILDHLARNETNVLCVRGNHEEMVTNSEGNAELDAVFRHSEIRKLMTDEMIAQVDGWPLQREALLGGRTLRMVHGSLPDPLLGYVYPDDDLSVFSPDCDAVFMGNTHYPFVRKEGETLFMNPGSCGMPRDQGDMGSVGLYDTESNGGRILRFSIKRETSVLLRKYPDTHSSVAAVFSRSKSKFEGDVVA